MLRHDPRFPPIKVELDGSQFSSEEKCSHCANALCCHYITQEIETPRSKYDFDFMLWQISHDNIQFFKDEGVWYMLVVTTCKHLKPGGMCGIYEKRPQICRDHSNDWCEFDEPLSKHWQLYFPDYETLDDYCRRKFKTWDRRHEEWNRKGARSKE